MGLTGVRADTFDDDTSTQEVIHPRRRVARLATRQGILHLSTEIHPRRGWPDELRGKTFSMFPPRPSCIPTTPWVHSDTFDADTSTQEVTPDSPTLGRALTLTHSHTHTLTLSHSHTLTLSHSHTLTLSHTQHSHSLTQVKGQPYFKGIDVLYRMRACMPAHKTLMTGTGVLRS